MSINEVVAIARDTIWIAIYTAAPMLLTSIIVGLGISILQTTTSIQEQTLTFVPKLVAIFVVTVLFGGFMTQTMMDFTIQIFEKIMNIKASNF
ncbi:MAG: flagellar biosynthesis protein FliQ [Candidatus Hydrogenedentota bacterium]